MGVTIRALRAQNRLQESQRGRKASSNLIVFKLDGFFLPNDGLKLLVRLLRRQFLHPSLQRLDLVSGALSDGPLGLSIIGPLFGQLLGG